MAEVSTSGRLLPNKYQVYPRFSKTASLAYIQKPVSTPCQTHILTPHSVWHRALRLKCRSLVESDPPTAASVQPNDEEEEAPRTMEDFVYTTADGKWRIRPVNKSSPEEIRQVVKLQTEGFHVGNPIPLIDNTLKSFFQAEVLSEMSKKLRYNPEDRFVCLVVESAKNSSSSYSATTTASQSNTSSNNQVVGVVEVSYIDEKEILKSLEPGTTWFVYVASMAVDPGCRRQGVATAMMEAAEQVALRWDEEQTLLHVYQDNTPAIELYKVNGYETIFQDPSWLARVAVRPRFLMRKRFSKEDWQKQAAAEQ